MAEALFFGSTLLSIVWAIGVWVALRRYRASRTAGPDAGTPGTGSKGPGFPEDRTVGSIWG
ncbi:MAG: hypothetical protein HY658_03310 [Actinobacteria bacterium]|nr:hypothetical protein [Actinomycetota bacterium]